MNNEKFRLIIWFVAMIPFAGASINGGNDGSVGFTVVLIGLSLLMVTGGILFTQEKKND